MCGVIHESIIYLAAIRLMHDNLINQPEGKCTPDCSFQYEPHKYEVIWVSLAVGAERHKCPERIQSSA